jgi:translocation and assembly module TamB
MAKRKARAGAERPRQRVGVFSLAILAVIGAVIWLAPAIVVHTSLRDRPLLAALAGIDGTFSSRSARWSWFSGIEYRDIVLADRTGQPVVIVPSLVIEKGLVSLVADPKNLGTVRLSGVEAVVAVRPGGSSLEDILVPWLAAKADPSPVACEIELVGATVELIDTLHADAWRVSDIFGAGSLAGDGGLAGWTAAGRVRYAGRAGDSAVEPAGRQPRAGTLAAAEPARLDRTTIPAAAAAALAREGGWSVSASPPTAAGRSLAVTTHRLPLGISSVAATRLESPRLADGLADVRLDLRLGPDATEIAGRLELESLAVCSSDTLAKEMTIERCEVPLDVVLQGGTMTIRELRAVSPVFEAEASGRLPLAATGSWQWLEQAVAHDCSVAARIDLAAVAKSLPGGLAVRPDVQVTGGRLQLAAIARADGADRVMEVRLDARNLAAVHQAAAAGDEPEGSGSAGERPLRWSEPFTGWLRGRRGPGREADLRIEEARLTSQAAELSVTGTPAALRAQWTVDLGGLVGELAELLDLGGVRLAGKARGRLDAERAGGGVTEVKVAASVADFELGSATGPAWKDASIALDGELVGSLRGSLAEIDRARGMLTAGGDAFEATLAGGVLIDTAIMTARSEGRREAWLRPAAAGGEVAADCSLAGDLGRWYARLAAAVPSLAVEGLEIGGSINATAAVTPEPAAAGDAWRITKAGGEVERFVLQVAGRSLAEPRVVATAAGMLRPSLGQVEISSAELLSSSLSLRSGGASWQPGHVEDATDPFAAVLSQVRGRLQWQADLTRLETWILPRGVAKRWPLAGRAWGTFDVAETQLGINLVAEATGSQVTVSRGPAGKGEPQPVWQEPQATLGIELTRPFARRADGRLDVADRVVIDRLAVESSTLAIAARGMIDDWSSRRRGELTGSLSYDWAQLSRLATPWTGGRIRLAGAVNRPFAVRASLGGPAAAPDRATAAAPPSAGGLPLPEAWLAATKGGEAEPGAAGRPRITVPVSPTASSRNLGERLAGLSLETSAAWTAADLDGFPLAAGDLAIRLVEGQLALGPFDIAASGGRLRGAPWWTIAPLPGDVVLPPGRVVDRVQLSGGLCRRLVSWISPLLSQATDTSAVVSVDVAGARLPLGDAFGGEVAAQVIFEAFEVRPSGGMQPLVNLLGKLQAAVDPRFALSDRPVLMRVRPEPIRLRLAERRIWHEGLVMDSGQFTVTSRGSVGADGSLAMLVEVALRGDLVGQTPVVAQLLRTPLAIPLKGTLARPQFDAGAIDVTIKRILENTARAVVDDGIGRGLEALFGRPPAQPVPSPPAPLTLPR